MKKSVILLLLATILLQGFSQQINADKECRKVLIASDSNENTRVILGKDLLVIEDGEDEFNLRIGNRGISILDSLESPKVRIYNYKPSDRWKNDKDEESHSRPARSFKGHWTGIEFGFNNYNHVTNMDLPDEIAYMSLHSGKSTAFNINFSQISLGLFRHFGFVSGLGLNWNNYVFSRDNNIIIGANGALEELISQDDAPIRKSKFTTLYLNVPAILELQMPTGEGHLLNIGAGVIGGIKLHSHTKMAFEDNEKLKSNTDLNLNLLRGGVTARIGYENFMIYGTYYLTPWFKENRGPGFYNLEPFEIGLALTFND